MKINNYITTNILKTYSTQNHKGKAVAKNEQKAETDRVEISAKGKELLELQKKVSELPEANSSRVEEIKGQIQRGEYKVNSEDIAIKMLDKRV